MSNRAMIGAAGIAAALLMSAVPASAQIYYDGPAAYAGGGPFLAPGPYDEVVPYAGMVQRGRYSAHRETYVDPYGTAHHRCRSHKACYEDGSSY